MTVQIEDSYELYEVVNAFPILKEKLQGLDFNVFDIEEGVSIHDFFIKMNMSEDEINTIVRKINNEINLYLKDSEKVKCPENDIQAENMQNNIFIIEDDFYQEKYYKDKPKVNEEENGEYDTDDENELEDLESEEE